MKHDPIEMKRVNRWPRKHTGLGGRRWNVWHSDYHCSLLDCMAAKSHLSNIMSKRQFICDGEKQWIVKRP